MIYAMKKTKKLFLLLLAVCMLSGIRSFRTEAAAVGGAQMKKITVKSYSSLQTGWKKVKNASGYVLYRKTGKGGYKKIVTLNGKNRNSYTDSGLETGTKYLYRVRAYRKTGKKIVWGAFSKAVSGIPRLDTPGITSINADKNGKFTVKWKKVPGASGYVLYRADKENGTYRKVKTIKGGGKTSWKDAGSDESRTCFYKVRAYRKEKKNVYSGYSKAKGKTAAEKPAEGGLTKENLEKQQEYTDRFQEIEKNISVDGEADTDSVISAVYEEALKGTKEGDILSVDKEEGGVVMRFSSGIWYVYQPEEEGIDASGSGSEISIVTLQPYLSSYSARDQKESLEATDNAAARIEKELKNYSFDKNYDDGEVTPETIRNLSGSQVVLCHSHGFYSSRLGSIIWTGETVNNSQLEEVSRYEDDLNAGRLVVSTTNNIGFTSGYVEKYCGNLAGSFLYLGTCFSGKDAKMAQSFLNKGAKAVVGNSGKIYRRYNCDMMEDIIDRLLTEDPSTHRLYTLEQALAYAKKENGENDYEWYPNNDHEPTTARLFGDKDFRLNSIIEAESVRLNRTEASLNTGETLTLTAAVLPSDASDRTVAWESSNAKVASVAGGTVTGISPGTAVITARTVNGKTAECTVTVRYPSLDAELLCDGGSGYKKLDCKGGPFYQEMASRNCKIKIKMAASLYLSSRMELSFVDGNTGSTYASCIAAPSQGQNVEYDSAEGCGYYWFTCPEKEGNTKIYYEITLASGPVLHPAAIESSDAFFVRVYTPEEPGSSGGGTENPAKPDGGTQEGDKAEDPNQPSGGGTENPAKPDGGTQEGDKAEDPDKSSGGGTENPAKPDGGTLEGDKTGNLNQPSGGGTENPAKPGGGTQEGDKAEDPDQPSGGGTENPAKPDGGTLEGDKTGNLNQPSGGGTENPAKPDGGTQEGDEAN